MGILPNVELAATVSIVNKPIIPKLPERLSPSAADTWHGCPKKWWGKYIVRISDPPGPAAELGTLVHSALEELYEMLPQERTKQAASGLIKEHAKKMTEDGSFVQVEDSVAFFREAWTRLLTIWKVENPEDVNVIATEQKLHTTVGDVPFSGIIDRLEYVDGVVTVSDYKSGKRPSPAYREPKDRQIQLYVAATNEATDYEVKLGRLIWLNANGAIWDVDSSPAAVDRTVEYFRNVWDEMTEAVKTDQWEERTSALCGWCPVLGVCESGKAYVRNLADNGKLKPHATAWAIVDQWE